MATCHLILKKIGKNNLEHGRDYGLVTVNLNLMPTWGQINQANIVHPFITAITEIWVAYSKKSILFIFQL